MKATVQKTRVSRARLTQSEWYLLARSLTNTQMGIADNRDIAVDNEWDDSVRECDQEQKDIDAIWRKIERLRPLAP